VPRRAAVAPLLFLLAATCLAQSHGFLVGVLRADGIIVPFASFDGKEWRDAWATPEQDVDVPVNIASVPKAWWGPIAPTDTWEAWLTSGGAPRSLHVKQPDIVPANCLRQIGLRTEYRSTEKLAPFSDHPYPKDGLVVSPPQPMEAIETVPKSAPEWKELLPVVTDAFNREERRMAGQLDADYPGPQKRREASAPIIESIYAYGRTPRIYAVEASREYPMLKAPGVCLALAFARVWLLRDETGVKPIATTVALERCDREDNLFMLPLGVMRAGSGLVWVAQLAGWDEERYVVIEITPLTLKTLVRRFGGWC
jgi:hypothetical protein